MVEAIHAEPKSIRELFSSWEFVIPDFQRPYSWEVDQCEDLWDDFVSFHKEKENGEGPPAYFLGSIVLHPADDNPKLWKVIDGQQRLTTMLLLSKVMHEQAKTYEALATVYKTVDKRTKKITEELRLNLNKQDNNKNDFQEIMLKGGRNNLTEKNKFYMNFRKFCDKFEDWQNENGDEIETLIDRWLDEVVLLPIQCNSEDHALTIFNTLNNRGMNLNDADIFKAKIYAEIENNERKEFIEQWNNLLDKDNLPSASEHYEFLFRIYMHILRANDGDTTKEKALRKYMMERWNKHHEELRNWKQLIEILDVCNHINNNDNSSSTDESLNTDETIYWAILKTAPNEYWKYPLYVFLCKHMKKTEVDGMKRWLLPEETHTEYRELMENTVRYFFIKAMARNSVNAVKDTTYKVCAAIAKSENYLVKYKESLTNEDIQDFEKILRHESKYRRCRKGLVFINSLCNENQNRADYAAEISLKKIHIEHILPGKWNNYGGWDENSYEQLLNRIGNLIPLPEKLNIAASNEFFSRKQKEYKKSKFQDAIDLSKKQDEQWYPDDVKKRHDEAIERLMNFFRG